MFFNWVTPLVNYMGKNDKLKLELYGDIAEEDKIDSMIETLKNDFTERTKNGAQPNSLIWSLVSVFKNDMFYVIGMQWFFTLI